MSDISEFDCIITENGWVKKSEIIWLSDIKQSIFKRLFLNDDFKPCYRLIKIKGDKRYFKVNFTSFDDAWGFYSEVFTNEKEKYREQ